jgi:hypothetical protein
VLRRNQHRSATPQIDQLSPLTDNDNPQPVW